MTAVQSAFTECSQNISNTVWEKIEDLKDERRSQLRKRSKKIMLDDDNLLDAEEEIKPLLCNTLDKVDQECSYSHGQCFTLEDSKQMEMQHHKQLAGYFESLFHVTGLSECEDVERPIDEKDYVLDYEGETNDINGPNLSDDNDYRKSIAPPSKPTSAFKPEEKKIEGRESRDDDDDYAADKADDDEDNDKAMAGEQVSDRKPSRSTSQKQNKNGGEKATKVSFSLLVFVAAFSFKLK